MTLRARRAGPDHGESARHAINTDVEKAAENQAKEKHDGYREREERTDVGSVQAGGQCFEDGKLLTIINVPLFTHLFVMAFNVAFTSAAKAICLVAFIAGLKSCSTQIAAARRVKETEGQFQLSSPNRRMSPIS